ncbi:putative cytochrome P450 [Annulohypoxylon nitens]|nr:putative cytochrome P450 [Annulohypoxylon nitens]
MSLIPLASLSVGNLAVISLILGILLSVARALYNVFLHPLRRYPGPLSHRVTILPRALVQMRGRLPFHVAELHRRYGPVVRVAPDELAVFEHLPTSIVNAEADEHGKLRREGIIGAYADLLVKRLREAVGNGGEGEGERRALDIREWYTWTTFDLIGDLSFGVEGGFGCLEGAKAHPWVKLINTSIRQQGRMLGLIALGLRGPLGWLHKSGVGADNRHKRIVKEKVAQRMKGGERPDFLDGLIRNKEALGLDGGRMANNASVLSLAGSETSATSLCGVTYFLTTHPELLKRLEQEVRTAFKSEDEITLTSVGKLSFMLACLNETLRCYPPFVTGAPRYTSKDAIIDGHFVPAGTVFSVYQYAINHGERYWKQAEKFAPERWMDDPEYKSDQLDAMQPFGLGPRNCIGRNLAYAEMRLILAKIVYNFDMSLAADSRDWLQDQKAYIVWDKPPLHVYLKPIRL